MNRKNTQILAALTLTALLSGCASLGQFEPPEVSVVNVSFDDLSLFETSGTVTVRITNENLDSFKVEGAVYNLYLNGINVGKALSNEHLTVPKLNSIVIEAPIVINNLALATRLRPLFQQRRLDYRIKSKLYIGRSYGTRKMTLDHEGSFDLPEKGSLGLGNRLEDELDG